MITDTFDGHTLAKMDVALERACLLLPTGSEKHNARRIIASKIIKCAIRGDASLSGLTEAGYAAAMQLSASRAVRQGGRGRQLGTCANSAHVGPRANRLHGAG